MYHLNLFGEFELNLADGKSVKVATRHAQLLLAYFLLNQDRSLAREKLVDLLWPDAAEAKGKQSLRQTLYVLRKIFEKEPEHKGRYFIADKQNIRFENGSSFEVDAVEFDAKIAQATSNPAEAQKYLEDAIAFYKGDLLQGCYKDWAFELQEYYRTQFLHAINQLVQVYAQNQQLSKAIDVAKRSLNIDALQEKIHRNLMQLYLTNGNRTAALKQYQECESILSSELEMEPLPETQQLYQDIVNHSAAEPDYQPQIGIDSFSVLDSPFVNRNEEINKLSTLWASAIENSGQAIMVGGEAGVGKTRLIGELEILCFKHDAITIRGRSFEFEGQTPFQPVSEAIRDAIPSILDKELSKLPVRVMSELVALNPSFEDLFPDAPMPKLLDAPEQQKNRTFENLTEFFIKVAKQRPVFFFVDDLQWADQLTLEFLHYLIRHIDAVSILVLGAYRQEEVHDLHPLVEMMDALSKDRKLESISLKPLKNQHISEMVEGILKTDLSSDWMSELLKHSQGIPFFAEELVKTSIESGILEQGSKKQWHVKEEKRELVAIPPSVEALVNQRQRRLSRAGRQLLETLSVNAHGMSAEVVRTIFKTPNLFEPLEELTQAHFLLEEGNQYRFRHDLLRQAIYRDLSSEKRRYFHGVVGDGLEKFYQDYGANHDPFSIVKLAHHFHQAERWKKALTYSLEAGKLVWEKNYAKEEAIQLFNQALEIAQYIDDQHGIMVAYKDLGQVCVTTNEQDLGFDHCQKALALCDTSEDRAEIYGYIASVYHHKREMEKGLEYCEKALKILGKKQNSSLGARISFQYISFLNWTRQFEKAEHQGQLTIKILEKWPNPALEAQLFSLLGQSVSGLGKKELAVNYLNEALSISKKLDDPMSVGIAHYYLGSIYFDTEEYELAIKSLQCSLKQIETLPDQNSAILSILNYIIYGYLKVRKLDRAKLFAVRQLHTAKLTENDGNIALSYAMLGCVDDALGNQDYEKYFLEGKKFANKDDRFFFHAILSYLYLDDTERALIWYVDGQHCLKQRNIERLKTIQPSSKTFNTFRKDNRFP